MVDYDSILLRAVTAPDAGDAQWRRVIYERARQMLQNEMRARRPPAPDAAIRAELSALETAIQRVEAQVRQDGATADRGRLEDLEIEPHSRPQQKAVAAPFRLSGRFWIALAVLAAVLGAAGYASWPTAAPKPATPISKNEARSAAPQPARPLQASAAKDGDLAPGVDGGSTDADMSYVFRRQPVFYRTLQPVGTIIIDKLQHFLYLIQPNNVALRYGIGMGEACEDVAGLRRISGKSEWPQWVPPADMIARKLARPGTLPGGPGNPLGARLMELDDGSSRIHGTNAPKTIGTSVVFGCIRMVNDDIVDLYNRAQMRTPVVIN